MAGLWLHLVGYARAPNNTLARKQKLVESHATFLRYLRIYKWTAMPRLIHLLGTLALALCISPLSLAQDANKIIDQYLKAVGGKKVISHIQTVSLDGTLTTGTDANSGTYTLKLKQPNRYYSEVRAQGKTQIQAYNGKSAWHQTDTGEINTLLGQQALQLEAAGQFYNTRLQDLAKRKVGASFKGHAQVRGKDALQLELTYPTGIQWEVFFDPQCRNIFQVFCTLYGGAAGGVGGAPPEARAVLAELGSDGSLIDRMAQILVETSVGSKERELPELLAELSHRHQERRLRELASEIGEAQRKGGDDALLTRLYDEKRRLSLSLHRRTRPGAGKGAG